MAVSRHPEDDRTLWKGLEIKIPQLTGKWLGSGSFGYVRKFELDGVKYAGKIPFEERWSSRSDPTFAEFEAKYAAGCRLVFELDHPNLVKFKGVFFHPNRLLPTMIMELMETDLHVHIATTPDISLSVKVSYLADVARGMAYLHSKSIVHRDLTAANVMVSSEPVVAKITDFGTAKYTEKEQVNTYMPGTVWYMPPEAFGRHPLYGCSLDVFSFGHLSLFTLTQVCPSSLKAATYLKDGKLCPRSEVERRQQHFNYLHSLIGEGHSLVHLISKCLDNRPEFRPSAEDLQKQLLHE